MLRYIGSVRAARSLLPATPTQSLSTMTQSTSSFKPTWPAGLYAVARPDYPREVIDSVLKATGAPQKPLNYVDLAAGTGIFTRLLIEASTKRAGNEYELNTITAVEPAEGMRAELSRLLFDDKAGLVPKLKAEGLLAAEVKTQAVNGLFNSIDLTPQGLHGKVDLVTIAQAWHWCEDWDGALKAIAQVLKKDGVLAIVWNLEDREAAKWVADVRDAYEKYEGNSRQYRHGTWREMYDTEGINLFKILPEKHLTRTLPTTLQGVCDRVASKSFVSMQTAGVQEQILQHVRSTFEGKTDEQLQRRWIDRSQGTFEYPYRTDVLLFQKK